ncbi:MerR family transcriptional regulator [Devosia geojensis]|uniref:MerR family transcriptional regulator n=1 Tax=Devosia geojensis TaxID=443610 RepID=A0A0F5FD89_9HYPH|nr:redox-sensitive transcriptional activator SoxR [Devosia geojensis]KKB06816.1 MerR family transcriptional regulator [Devosia geojensis]
MTPELTVGELAARSGVAISTLHFYEAKGLLSSHRTLGDQRRYERSMLRRVAVIRVAQELGLSLAEIAAAFATLPDNRTPNHLDWIKLSARWRKDLDRRIAQMKKLRDGLTDCIGCGCLSLVTCPLRNPGDRLGKEGPGPRRLMVRR